jgi:uncharacterized protein YdhG (YjbR/CyaY superfamily)
MSSTNVPATIDAYIAAAPEAVRPILHRVRALIRAAAPDAKETIAWSMPTFRGRYNLVHFAAHKAHLGLYPGAEAMVRFQDALKEYKTSKGAIQFPYAKPLPEALITEIVLFRVAEDSAEHA